MNDYFYLYVRALAHRQCVECVSTRVCILKLIPSYTFQSMSTTSIPELTLSPGDIPGAVLSKPYARHTGAALRWWLLAKVWRSRHLWKSNWFSTGMYILLTVHTWWNYYYLPCRVNETERENRPIVDVDCSYLYGKYKSLTESEVQVELPLNPPPPISGWRVVKQDNFESIASSIPPVTSALQSCPWLAAMHWLF